MPMLSEAVDAVIGVDTHRDSHTMAMCSPIGAALAVQTIPNTDAGYRQAKAWIDSHAPGPRLLVAMEGTRSYGVGFARALNAAGLQVVEVEHPSRKERRGKGKDDAIDAQFAARHALRSDASQLAAPRADGVREALRILLTARQELATSQTRHINQLRALLLTGDNDERALARGAMPKTKLRHIAARRGRTGDNIEIRVRRQEAKRLAAAILTSRDEITANTSQLTELVNTLAPRLLDLVGVGPVSAAQAIVSWSHPGRCRNDAAFASLAGACPIPASSGNTSRHRLNRGGDRALNRALHAIVTTRWRMHSTTIDYVERRRAEGKTDPEIRRCLKRYIARKLHRELTKAMTAEDQTTITQDAAA